MSEARRNVPREVPQAPQGASGDNLANRLAEYARTYIGRCEGFHYQLTPPDNAAGQPKSAEDVLLLNWVRMQQGEQQATRELAKLPAGTSDAEKIALITKTVQEWKPSGKLGAEFRETALHRAADQVVYDLLKADGRRVEATYDAECKAETDKARAAKEKAIATILTAPDRADKYEAQLRAKLSAIFAARYNPVRRSKSGAVEVEDDTSEIGV